MRSPLFDRKAAHAGRGFPVLIAALVGGLVVAGCGDGTVGPEPVDAAPAVAADAAVVVDSAVVIDATVPIDASDAAVPFACMAIDGTNFGPIKNLVTGASNGFRQTLAQTMANSFVPGLSIAVRDIDGTV